MIEGAMAWEKHEEVYEMLIMIFLLSVVVT